MKRRPPQLDVPVSRRRVLSVQEMELWKSVMEDGHHTDEAEAPIAQAKPEMKPTTPIKKEKPNPAALDGPSRSKIRKGTWEIHATLDLHGLTVEKAYQMLVRFVARMQGEHSRVVLVITGKGRAPQSGILRTQLPHWLELQPLAGQVSGFSPASTRHGGEGAWYVKIRKKPMVKL